MNPELKHYIEDVYGLPKERDCECEGEHTDDCDTEEVAEILENL